jgi:hypothetical protein
VTEYELRGGCQMLGSWNRGSNTQGLSRSLKFGMVHPDDPTRYLMLEILLNAEPQL